MGETQFERPVTGTKSDVVGNAWLGLQLDSEIQVEISGKYLFVGVDHH